jgi:hypothetical protein
MANTPQEEEILIEAAATAFRPETRDGLGQHPAFRDLDGDGRARAFDVVRQLRAMEAALDAEGLSSTARAVLRRIRR